MDKSAIDTPSREIDLRNAASALVRHLPRRMRSDGLETVNVRTSRGTTVPVTTPYYREKHARRAKRRPGLYPALVVLGIYDRCTPKLASDASRAVAMLSSLAEAQAQLRSEGHRPGYQDPPLDRLSLRCAGPSGPAERGVRSAGPRDREAGGRLPRRGPRPCEAQEAWPQDEEGAQPIPYRLEGTEAPHPVRGVWGAMERKVRLATAVSGVSERPELAPSDRFRYGERVASQQVDVLVAER